MTDAPLGTAAGRLRTALGVAALFALAALPARAQMPFGPVTARSAALGGAAVGFGPDVALAPDNPALAPDKSFAFALTAGLVTRENGDYFAPLDVIAGNNPVKLASGAQPQSYSDVVAALHTLADPGNGMLGNGNVSIAAAHAGWELSFTDRGFSGTFVRADLVHTALGANPANSIAFNTSTAVFRGLELKDLALAKSVSFLAGQIAVGAAVHALWGTTFAQEESAFTTDAGAGPFSFAQKSLDGVARTHADWSVDAGALLTLGPVHVGGVWRGINRPSFPYAEGAPAAERGQSVTWGSQARVGASVHVPLIGLTFAADCDLTANDTLVEGLKSREAGGGVEWTIVTFVVRAGASVNLESPDRKPALTGGAGVVIGPAKVDLGGVYRTADGALGVVATAHFGI
jgi:hypothetical protein